MNKVVFKSFLCGMSAVWGLIFLIGCDQGAAREEAFRQEASRFRQWRTKGWGGVMPRDWELVTCLSSQIQSESNMIRRARLYAYYTNELVNVPFFVTNGIVKTTMLREALTRPGGIEQPPYMRVCQSYLSLLDTAMKGMGIGHLSDSLYLRLEMWRRLGRELSKCEDVLTTWTTLRYEDYPRKRLAGDVEEAKTTLRGYMGQLERDIESCLERCERKHPDESCRAYELFRKVIGREANPRYRRRAQETAD